MFMSNFIYQKWNFVKKLMKLNSTINWGLLMFSLSNLHYYKLMINT